MIDKKRSASSKHWLREYLNDKYVQESKKKGLRSRAWFKIKEIQQIDKIFKPGMTVIDLGSSPGSWSQYVIKQIGLNGHIIACDLMPMVPIDGVNFFQGNFCDEIILKALLNYIGDKKVQVIMSDMSPNISGISTIDVARSMYLVESALDMCHKVLTLNGSFIVKVFYGNELNNFLKKIHYFFVKVKIRKPAASRSRSREVYIVATGYKV